MTLERDIPHDELLLAQLAALKLVRVLEGTFSLGLSLGSSTVDYQRFLERRYEIIKALITVLDSMTANISSEQALDSLRDSTRQLFSLLNRLQSAFSLLQRCASGSSAERRAIAAELGSTYSMMMETVSNCLCELGAPASNTTATKQQSQMMIESFVATLADK